MEEFPHLRDLYGRLKKQGFELVSVNYGDTVKQIDSYVKEGKFNFPIVRNNSAGVDVSKLYKVEAYPTNYLLDADGKIAARFVGYDKAGMDAALRKLGFKL
ncbi:MAG TPA: TlpA disulfide reductase family protein [Fimbriimonas sp.]